MSNNDPKRESELDDFRRALTQQGVTQQASAPGESTWDRITAGLRDVADRSTGWAAARIKDMGQDFVGKFLLGETATPEPSDKHLEQAQERDKGLDR
jgi:hypothetical protein